MKVLAILFLGLLFAVPLFPREIDIRLWISGGMQGLVVGSRECPGWLSVARQLELEDPDGCWMQVGIAPLDVDQLKVPGLKFPDLIVPSEADFRLHGLSGLENIAAELSLLNVEALPQFPEYSPAFLPLQIWSQPDGAEIYAFSVISEKAPLRIPADRLRPLRVLSPLEALRSYLTEHPLPGHALGVLVLPEDADPSEWSDLFPEFALLIQAPGTQSKIIEVHKGRQLRVQPARFGRSMLRVQLYWDTVSRRFRNPKAEGVWVNAPELQGVELSGEILERLHPVRDLPQPSMKKVLLENADAALLPEHKQLNIESRLPDALRVAAVPEDDALARVQVSRAMWNRWKELSGYEIFELERKGNDLYVLLTAETIAGAGDWGSMIRQDILKEELPLEWMPFTQRDLLFYAGDK